jgi:hypothetical protein
MNDLNEEIIKIKSMLGLITEDRYKGFRRFLKDNLFGFMPDYVFNEIFRETGDFHFEKVKGMSKKEMIDYFTKGPGRAIYDRWGGFKDRRTRIVELSWDDLTPELQRFLKEKMTGVSKSKIEDIKEREPGLGFGKNEPILIKYNDEDKIEEIIGGNHRVYAAFELNNFDPILMNAYISK